MRDVYGRGKYATLQHRHFVTSPAAPGFPNRVGPWTYGADPATTEGEYVVAGEKDSSAADFAGPAESPAGGRRAENAGESAAPPGPVACMRVPKSGSLSRSPRMPRTIDMTCAARSGKCSASHSRNRSFTSHGSRSMVYPASDAPASRDGFEHGFDFVFGEHRDDGRHQHADRHARFREHAHGFQFRARPKRRAARARASSRC